MNEKDAILLIEEMISKTKGDMKDNGFYYYLWGWLVFIAAITNLIIYRYELMEIHSWPWMVLMPLGGIVTMVASFKERKKEQLVKTYVSNSMHITSVAFSVSLFIVCFAMPFGNQWKAFYPTILVIYAVWLFISGGLLKYKPLMWGAALNWAAAITGYLWPNLEVHLLLIAIGVLGGYIIPGHLLKARFDKRV